MHRRTFWMFSLGAILTLGAIAAIFLMLSRVMPGAYGVSAVSGERTAHFTKGSIRYQDVGNGGTTVLFLHGFNAHLGQWNALWPLLEGCACRRIRVDVPGFGLSAWSSDDFSLPRQGERIIALLDQLHVEKVVLAGTSMGASLAASIAAAHPGRVSAIVLMAPSGYPGGLTYPGLFGKLIRPGSLNHSATIIARSSLYRRLFPSSRAVQTLSLTASYGAPWADALPLIEAPALILWSRHDRTANPNTAESVAGSIRNSTLVWLDASAGHSIPNNRPDLAAAAITHVADGHKPDTFASRYAGSLLHDGENNSRAQAESPLH